MSLCVIAASVVDLYALYPWLDMPSHFAGGIAVTHFFRVALANAQAKIGRIPRAVQLALSLGLTVIAAVVWELLEYLSDVALGTTMTLGTADTLSDLLFAMLGSLCVVGWHATRRVKPFQSEQDCRNA